MLGFGNLAAHNAAQVGDPPIDDAVINLYPFTPFAQNLGLVQRIQMLRHIGLRGVNFTQQLAHILFRLTQAHDNPQPHGG